MKTKALVIELYSLLNPSIDEVRNDLSLMLGELVTHQYNASVRIRLDVGNYLVKKDGEKANILTSSVPRLHLIVEGKDLDWLEHWVRPTIASLPSFHFLDVFRFESKALTKKNVNVLEGASLKYYLIDVLCPPSSTKREIRVRWDATPKVLMKQSH